MEDSVAAKSTKTKTKQTKSSPHLHLLVGSIFSLLGSWILIALFTLYAKGNTNWLGPYLGNIWITSLLEFFWSSFHFSIFTRPYLFWNFCIYALAEIFVFKTWRWVLFIIALLFFFTFVTHLWSRLFFGHRWRASWLCFIKRIK